MDDKRILPVSLRAEVVSGSAIEGVTQTPDQPEMAPRWAFNPRCKV